MTLPKLAIFWHLHGGSFIFSILRSHEYLSYYGIWESHVLYNRVYNKLAIFAARVLTPAYVFIAIGTGLIVYNLWEIRLMLF